MNTFATLIELKELSGRKTRFYTVVILFNGGVKTVATAQNCPNVSGYFYQANRLAVAIDEQLRFGELRMAVDETRLVYPLNFELSL